MNLYSNKQKWKIALMLLALIMVGVFLVLSNTFVNKMAGREKERAKQWADAIKKKLELVQLTDRIFSQLREQEQKEMTLWINATKELSKESPLDQIPDFSFPIQIINQNKNIPVIVLDHQQNVSSYINLGFDTSDFKIKTPKNIQLQKTFEDSLKTLCEIWQKRNQPFTIEVYKGMYMTYYYYDSKEIIQLEKERDSLIQSFNQELIDNKGLVPVLLVDAKNGKVVGSNLKPNKINSKNIQKTIEKLKANNAPLIIDFKDGERNLLYYDDSPEIVQLTYFPYIIFSVIGLFVLIAYLLFSTFRKAEQNQVWAGMAKETAHQLGTPLSSMMAWLQLLESQNVDPMIAQEMKKDLDRLEKISDRFSKIGSGTKMEVSDLNHTVENVLDYLRLRISKKVKIVLTSNAPILISHNASLMEWVIENICKNAVDAMSGEGILEVKISEIDQWIHIDIKDNGKGIASKQLQSIFKPGFSTKKRGWGLGLTLVKRIVEEYHKGKVFVLESQINGGTTFRISLPKK